MRQPKGELTGKLLLGKLRVLRRLGAGASGAVYEVEHALTHNRHALKVLHPSDAMSPLAAQRLVREAGVAGRVNSERIVQTLDVGQLEDGRPFILMELLVGRTWRALLDAQGSLHPTYTVRLALQVCQGLAAAHAAGIVHRDLKPDNVFLAGAEGHEDVKILDFGIGKQLHEESLTLTGALMGTPHYLSPEQADGRGDVDGRADQYALAVMLYESLAGRRPFRSGGELAHLLVQITTGQHEPLERAAPHLPPGLAAVIERAMRVDRAARFESVEAFAARLRVFGADADTSARTGAHPATPPPPALPRAAAPIPDYSSIPETPPSATLSPDRPAPPVPLTRRPPPVRRRRRSLMALAAVGLLLALGTAATLVALLVHGAGHPEPRASIPPEPLADGGTPDDPGAQTDAPGTDTSETDTSETDTSQTDAGGGLSPSGFMAPSDDREAALVREIRVLTERRDYHACLERSEQDEPTPAVLERRALCAGNLGCFGVYRRACARLGELAPRSMVYRQSCLALADVYPIELERGPSCRYRD